MDYYFKDGDELCCTCNYIINAEVFEDTKNQAILLPSSSTELWLAYLQSLRPLNPLIVSTIILFSADFKAQCSNPVHHDKNISITFPQPVLGGSSVKMICVCLLAYSVMATMTVEIWVMRGAAVSLFHLYFSFYSCFHKEKLLKYYNNVSFGILHYFLYPCMQTVMWLKSNARTASANPFSGSVMGWMIAEITLMRKTVVRMKPALKVMNYRARVMEMISGCFFWFCLQGIVKLKSSNVEMAFVFQIIRSVMATTTVGMAQMNLSVRNVRTFIQ